jgi:hypothetical protein
MNTIWTWILGVMICMNALFDAGILLGAANVRGTLSGAVVLR